MTLYIFLMVSSLMIMKPTVTSLFLSKFTVSRLPAIFVLIALFAAPMAVLYSRLLKRVHLITLIIKTLQVAIAFTVLFRIFLPIGYLEGPMLYIFYVWSSIFALISVSQFWILANIVFNSREVKRLIGFIGSGAIAGGVVGGYFTKLLAQHMGSENLILICILLFMACIFITRSLVSGTAQDERLQRFRQKQHADTATDSTFALVTGSRHLTLLACILGISVMVGKFAEYQFSAIASSTIVEEDHLTAFFGFWYSNINIAALLIQLFVTRRVVGVFGVGVSLFFLPMGILLGATLILFYPSLWAAILIKMSDGSLKNSINKAGIELLTLPIPLNVKSRAKLFIDVFVDSCATGLGGLLLILVTTALGFTVQKVSLIVVFFICIWIYLITRIRSEYIHAFRVKLEHDSLPGPESVPDLKNESVLGGLIKVMESDDSGKTLNALKMVKEVRNTRLVPSLRKLIRHRSNAVRLEALKILCYYTDAGCLEEAGPLILDPDQEIRTEAMHYLFGHWEGNRTAMLKSYLTHDDYLIRGAALLCAARESRSNPKLAEVFGVRETVIENLKNLSSLQEKKQALFVKINCARAIGAANIPELYPYLHILLNDESEEVLHAAIMSAGESRQNEFIPVLIRFLGRKGLREPCARAIAGFTPQVIDMLYDYLRNPFADRSIILAIPSIMSSIGTQRAVNMLIQLLDQDDPSIRYEIIRALNRLRADSPGLKFEGKKIVSMIMDEARDYLDILAALYVQSSESYGQPKSPISDTGSEIDDARAALIRVLERRLDYNIERIFRLLGLKYPPGEIYDAYLGIQSGKPDLRINAVEYLDSILENNLRRVVIPIIETPIADTMIDQTVERLRLAIPSEFEGMHLLLSRDDRSLLKNALQLITLQKDDRYLPYIGRLINHPDLEVRRSARLALKNMGFPL